MKKIILAVFFCLAMAGVSAAQAGPFITSACTPTVDNVTSFTIQFDGGAWTTIPAVTTCATTPVLTCTGTQRMICYDIAPLSSGSHVAKARAVNAVGSSVDSAPLSFTKQSLPGAPTLQLIP
jgi:hypothetical protein